MSRPLRSSGGAAPTAAPAAATSTPRPSRPAPPLAPSPSTPSKSSAAAIPAAVPGSRLLKPSNSKLLQKMVQASDLIDEPSSSSINSNGTASAPSSAPPRLRTQAQFYNPSNPADSRRINPIQQQLTSASGSVAKLGASPRKVAPIASQFSLAATATKRAVVPLSKIAAQRSLFREGSSSSHTTAAATSTSSKQKKNPPCPECQTIQVKDECPNIECSLCPDYEAPKRAQPSRQAKLEKPASSTHASTSSTAAASKDKTKKRPFSPKPDSDSSSSEDESTARKNSLYIRHSKKRRPSTTKPSHESSSSSSSSEDESMSSRHDKKRRLSHRSSTPSPSPSLSSHKKLPSRKSKPSNLRDEQEWSDDEDDEDFEGPSSSASKKKRKIDSSTAAPSSSSSNPNSHSNSASTGGLGLISPSGRYKVSTRDQDLSLALALSRSTARQEDLEFVAALSANAGDESNSIWDEKPNDPRHLESRMTGMFVVHQTSVTPKGFCSERVEFEELKREKDIEQSYLTTSAAYAALPPAGILSPNPRLPILLRNGFQSVTPLETRTGTMDRANAFQTLASHTSKTFRNILREGEQELFGSILKVACEIYTDLGSTGEGLDDVNAMSALRLETGFVSSEAWTTESNDNPLSSLPPIHRHPTPLMLLHSPSLADHALQSSAFITFLRNKRNQRMNQSITLQRELLALKYEQERKIIAAERRREREKAEKEKEKEKEKANEKTKSKSKSGKKDHNYRGASEVRKLEMDPVETGIEVGNGEELSLGSTNVFPIPVPFVIGVPSSSASILALLKSIYLLLIEHYPSPKSLSFSANRARSNLSMSLHKMLDKNGPQGGIPFVISKISQWNEEWREHERYRYDVWRKARQAKESSSTAIHGDSMDSEERKSEGSKKGQKRAANGSSKAASDSFSSSSKPSSKTTPLSANQLSDVSSPDFYPSYIYPRIMLLIESFDEFPADILRTFLELIQSPSSNLHFERIPFILTANISGGTELVHSILTKQLADGCYFISFEMKSNQEKMDAIVREVLLGEEEWKVNNYITKRQTKPSSDINHESTSFNPNKTPSFHSLPFILGSNVTSFLLQHFYRSSGSLSDFLRQIRFCLLDKCDSSSSKPSPNQSQQQGQNAFGLGAGYGIAWMKRNKGLPFSSESSSPSESSPNQEQQTAPSDAVIQWVHSLKLSELALLRTIPSLSQPTVREAVPKDSNKFREYICTSLHDIEVARFNFSRSISILHELMTMVGFYQRDSAHQLQHQSQSSGLNSERELWIHCLSNPLFNSLDHNASSSSSSSSSSSAASIFILSSASKVRYPKLDSLFNRFDQVDKLKSVLQKQITQAIETLEEILDTIQGQIEEHDKDDGDSSSKDGEGFVAALRWRKRVVEDALQKWNEQLELIGSKNSSAAATAASAAPSSSPPSSVPTSVKRIGASSSGKNRRNILLAPAQSILSQRASHSSSILTLIHSFLSSMIRPLLSFPLAEIVSYEVDSVRNISNRFVPGFEETIWRALNHAEYYLGTLTEGEEDADAGAADAADAADGFMFDPSAPFPRGSPPPPSPHHEDVCLAFGILNSMNGLFVNLADWFMAFKNVARMGSEYERKGGMMGNTVERSTGATAAAAAKKSRSGRSNHAASSFSSAAAAASSALTSSPSSSPASSSSLDPLSDSSLQVRFLLCLSTLANLGYIKSTKRRVDHVLKLVLHTPQ